VHYSLELTTYNGSIYETFGALNNTYLSSLYIWNLNFANHTMTKVPVADIGSGRAAHGIVMIGSIMISLGGVTASGAFETWYALALFTLGSSANHYQVDRFVELD